MSDYCTIHDGYLTLSVRVTPNAKRHQIEGLWNNTHLKIALRAPAVEGKANEALIAYLADLCQVKKACIEILSGQTNRCKIVKISGNTDRLRTALGTY